MGRTNKVAHRVGCGPQRYYPAHSGRPASTDPPSLVASHNASLTVSPASSSSSSSTSSDVDALPHEVVTPKLRSEARRGASITQATTSRDDVHVHAANGDLATNTDKPRIKLFVKTPPEVKKLQAEVRDDEASSADAPGSDEKMVAEDSPVTRQQDEVEVATVTTSSAAISASPKRAANRSSISVEVPVSSASIISVEVPAVSSASASASSRTAPAPSTAPAVTAETGEANTADTQGASDEQQHQQQLSYYHRRKLEKQRIMDQLQREREAATKRITDIHAQIVDLEPHRQRDPRLCYGDRVLWVVEREAVVEGQQGQQGRRMRPMYSTFAGRLREEENCMWVKGDVQPVALRKRVGEDEDEEDETSDDEGEEAEEEGELVNGGAGTNKDDGGELQDGQEEFQGMLEQRRKSDAVMNGSETVGFGTSSNAATKKRKRRRETSGHEATHRFPKRAVRPTSHIYGYTAVRCSLPPAFDKLNASSFRSMTARIHNAIVPEELVPIRIDLDVDGNRLRDAFVWNMNETLLTPERFADIFCTDCDLPPERFAPEIAATIHEHLQAHARTLHTRAHRLPAAASATNTGAVAPIIPIELHVQLGRTLLHDKFHWDTSILNMLTPEAFAEQLVADMGLGSGEHVQLVAHAIREQLVQYHQAADDDEEREDLEAEEVEMMAVRDGRMVREWGPRVDVMSAEDWAEVLRTQERESRRNRRASNKRTLVRR